MSELLIRKVGNICFVLDEKGKDVSGDYADSLNQYRDLGLSSFSLSALGYENSLYPTDCLELSGESLAELSHQERVDLFLTALPQDQDISFRQSKQVELFKPFTPLKARTGYGLYEFNNKQDLWEMWAKERIEAKRPIAVQAKFDGIRLIVFRKGDRVQMLTEDKKRDRASILPEVVAEIKSLPGDSCILDVEAVIWQENQPIPRREMIKMVVGKTPLRGEDIHINVHDCLLVDGKPLNTEPYSVRLAALDELLPKDKKFLRKAQTWVAKTKSEFLSALDKASAYPGSEGAMVKTLDSDYPIRGRTREETADWGKLKLAVELHCKVIGRTRKPNPWPPDERPKRNLQGDEALKAFRKLQKGSKTFYYRCALRDGKKLIPIDSEHKLTPGNLSLKWDAEHEGGVWKGTDDPEIWEMAKGFENRPRGDWAYGNTYAVKYDPPPKLGDIITVAPILMRAWKDNSTTHYSWTFPRCKEFDPTRTQPDTVQDAERIVAKSPKSIRKHVRPGPFGHPGGKTVLLKHILPRIPAHETYCEPYVGSGAVFFAKPKAHKSVLGDTDPEIIAALRFVRDASAEDIEWLRKQNWQPSKGRWQFLKDQKPVRKRERFYRFRYLDINSWAHSPAKGFARSNQPASMKAEMDKIRAGQQKLRGNVSIVQQDAFKTMRENDSLSTFHYIDPPYWGSGDLQPYGGKAPDPEALVKFLKGLRGKWLLSMADKPRTRKAFKDFNIKSVSRQMTYTVYSRKTKAGQPTRTRRELLIANYDFADLHEAVVPPGEGEKPTHKKQRAEAERKFGDPYMVHQPPDKTFPFVYMHHERGIWTQAELVGLRAALKNARRYPDLIPDIWKRYKPVVLTTSLESLRRDAEATSEKRGDVTAAVHKHLDEKPPKVLPSNNKILNVGNVHGDWRMRSPEGEFLIGWTLSTPSVVLQFADGKTVYPIRDRFLENKEGDKIVAYRKCPNPLCDEERYLRLVESNPHESVSQMFASEEGEIILGSQRPLAMRLAESGAIQLLAGLPENLTQESVQPMVWLTIVNPKRLVYQVSAGGVGATAKTGARFIFRDAGKVAYGCQKSDFHEGFFWFNRHKNLSGRWGVQELAGRPEYTKLGTEGNWWMVNHVVKDPRPYILRYSRDAKERQAKKEHLKHIIWNADVLKVLKADPHGRKWLGLTSQKKLDEKWAEFSAGNGEFRLRKSLSFSSKLFHSPAAEKQLFVYGAILIPGKTDAQGHHVTAIEVAKAIRTMGDIGFDIEHSEKVSPNDLRLTQIFQAPVGFKIGSQHFKKGTAIAEIAVLSPAIRKRVLSGEIRGFSISGKGVMDNSAGLYDIKIQKISLVGSPAIKEDFIIKVEDV